MAGLCSAPAWAQTKPIRSYTGQFAARTLQQEVLRPAQARPVQTPVAGSWAYLLKSRAAPASTNSQDVLLEPWSLVVTCERIKALALGELGLLDQWQGRIDLTINPSWPVEKGPQLTAIRNPEQWTYELVMPRSVQQEMLLRSVIQTLLLEMANRQAGVQSAQIPLWLVEGISADLQANNLPTFIIQPEQRWSANIVWQKGPQAMPLDLRRHAPITFQRLSWPQASDLTAEGLPLYRHCARLFLEQLLQFPDGRACLRSMIGQLPQHWNWQTAFLLAFHSHFDQLLDVEKWWSVSYVDFVRGCNLRQASAAEDGRRELQDCLDVPVEVHFRADRMPVGAKITLQEALRQWAPADAHYAVQRAAGGLTFLAPQAPPALRPLVELYLKTLLDYLRATPAAPREPSLGKHAPSLLSRAKADAIQQLNALDRRRETLRNRPDAVSTNLPQFSALAPPATNPAHDH